MIISYPLMVKKFTTTAHKVYEPVAVCTTALRDSDLTNVSLVV